MKALRSQMNPHFIFNALQSIQTFLLNHKTDDANLYLLKFSKLMRAVLENSQFRDVPISDDLKALELYMQLESIRLPHPFTYAFHIDEAIDADETTIPPLILQPFVENAIWHGLQFKESPGHIDIFISKNNGSLVAAVHDNGIGRDMSRKVAQPMLMKKESLGMKLTEDRLRILSDTRKVKAHFNIIDLFNNQNKPSGTKVELSLPIVA
jgi:LytS/YehU family sensor histidine kinase